VTVRERKREKYTYSLTKKKWIRSSGVRRRLYILKRRERYLLKLRNYRTRRTLKYNTSKPAMEAPVQRRPSDFRRDDTGKQPGKLQTRRRKARFREEPPIQNTDLRVSALGMGPEMREKNKKGRSYRTEEKVRNRWYRKINGRMISN
jgi:hypothetical protein